MSVSPSVWVDLAILASAHVLISWPSQGPRFTYRADRPPRHYNEIEHLVPPPLGGTDMTQAEYKCWNDAWTSFNAKATPNVEQFYELCILPAASNPLAPLMNPQPTPPAPAPAPAPSAAPPAPASTGGGGGGGGRGTRTKKKPDGRWVFLPTYTPWAAGLVVVMMLVSLIMDLGSDGEEFDWGD